MNNTNISVLLLAIAIGFSGCNSSSSDNKPGAVTPPPAGPVDLTQLDANEATTTELTNDEQDVAYETMTDAGRVSYVNSTSQDNTTGDKGFQAVIDTVKSNKITPAQKTDQAAAEQKYFANEELAKSILAAVNDKVLCNPTVQKSEQTVERSAIHFTTSGAGCAMVMETKIEVNNIQTQTNSDAKATGSFKFTMNENALAVVKQQDLISGEINFNFNQKSKYPSQTDSTFTMAGKGSYTGTLVSKRLGTVQFSQTDVMSMSMDTQQPAVPVDAGQGAAGQGAAGPGAMNPMAMNLKAVSQIELKAQNKRVVFTVKMDSTAAEPVVCTMNKKKVEIEKCKELVNQLSLKPQT